MPLTVEVLANFTTPLSKGRLASHSMFFVGWPHQAFRWKRHTWCAHGAKAPPTPEYGLHVNHDTPVHIFGFFLHFWNAFGMLFPKKKISNK